MNFNSPPMSPIEPAQGWFDQAESKSTRLNPLAMALSTVDCDGRPSSRIVLLKGFDERGAVFYTNYNSDKSQDISESSVVSLLFHWDDMQRQLRIQGHATRVSTQESDEYFASRASLSQLGAWASDQSKPLQDRESLVEKVDELKEQWKGQSIPRPEHWGGYRVSLENVELWQGHDGRLHDRIRYTNIDGDWSWKRLQP